VAKITIAIDGFSSCGKSTLAKALAQKLNYRYIDTGAMYRSVTLYALRNGMIDEKKNVDEKALVKALKDIKVDFKFNTFTKTSETYLNGENVEHEIRGMMVSDNVSKVSSIHEVREKMVALQREMGKDKAVILDGRDIGTNVFPHAELKIFMTADNDIRARRRLDEYTAHGQYFTFEEVKLNLHKRDYADTHRKENPLTRAKDAIVLDNTDLTPDEQLDYVVKLIADMQLTKDIAE
jgi:cytidylate kinase